MNLYVINPEWAPHNEVDFILAENDADAMHHGVFVAAKDAVEGYDSPSADVYLVAENVKHVGQSYAAEAPLQWEWAHPAVEEQPRRHAVEDLA